ncbi:hypothetical protein [Legionella drozanskii]|uniref:Uncharacterized protein n=1 Tax=Legionella drozanskii LLAP-1 TaxID=1212489 RepID=A0A0W0SRC9_9GAMM|nr:hypothetical protein [Legionella drozanskii]KTC85920.1 hypothetical protein Ldro_2245 [Legionella drozanskii LLAP-1]
MMLKEYWAKELKVIANANAKNLKELAKLFATYGTINSRAQGLTGQFFEFVSDYSDIEKARNEIWNPYYEVPDWQRMDEIHGALYRGWGNYRGPGYRDEFKALKSKILAERRDEDESSYNVIFDRFELAAERYLRHLEIRHECLKKWIKVYEEGEEDMNPHAQYGHLEYFIRGLQNEIDDFHNHLYDCYLYFSEDSLEEPLPEENLDEILETLHNSYKASYQAMNFLWRLIKQFFQRSERDQEIEFLATLSKTEGCTDSIRMDAIALVHNKIANETFGSETTFGSGSRLREILANLFAQKEDTVEMSEEDELSLFINEHNLELPPELAAYYKTVYSAETMAI